MASAKLVTGQRLVYFRLFWLSTIAYFLIRNPKVIYSSKFVVAIGSSVSTLTGAGSEGLVAVLMLFQVINDLAHVNSVSYLNEFMDVLPMRLLFLLIATFLSYIVKWKPLATAPTVTYLFFDTILTGFTFTVIRDEHNERNKEIVRQQRGFAEQEQEY